MLLLDSLFPFTRSQGGGVLRGGALVVRGGALVVALTWAPLARAQDSVSPDAETPTGEGALPGRAEPDAEPTPTDETPAEDQAPGPESIQPPEVLTRVEAVSPNGEPVPAEGVTTVLLVVVLADGTVGEVTVAESGGAAFDQAAMSAMKAWSFRPALRGGAPVAARIRVPFLFSPPVAEPPRTPPPASPPNSAEAPPAAPAESVEIMVEGERSLRNQDRSASDYTIHHDVIAAAPRQEGAEVLRTVPGLYISRPEGLSVAHRYTMRGFDSDHGQDIEFTVGGIPINLPSHIHGQGYADLSFLIADAVEHLHASEGVYDPRQGDFAVAGTIDVHLGVAERGWRLKSSYGAFDTFRQMALWAPPGQKPGTFGAAQYTTTGGFGANRSGEGGSGMVQAVFGSGEWRHRVLGILYASRSNHAGVVRADDVASGRVGFYDVYPYATARAQNGLAARMMTGYFAEYRGKDGDTGDLGIWSQLDDFRLQENFTGFTQRSQTLANVAGRGDLFELRNRTKSVGLTGRYRTALYQPAAFAQGTVEFGMSGRMDEVDQTQNLIDAAVHSQTWDNRVDASILGADLGFWGDLDWRFTRYVRVRAGVRGDALLYDVEDRLGNFAPATRPQDSYITGFRRSAMGVAVGPRTSLEVKPSEGIAFRAAYGEGYRSPQARMLDDGEKAPFTKVRSADLGVKFGGDEQYELSLGGYYTHLSDDVAFDPKEGRLERIGETRRMGAVVYGRVQPIEGLIGAASATFVDAELLEPPPATPEEPDPPFKVGQSLPYVPPLVVRLDLGGRRALVKDAGRWDLVGKVGFGFSFLSPRPLPYGAFADPVSLLDASAGVVWGPFDLTFEAFNLLDQRYSSSEYFFSSNWDPDAPQTRAPARHSAAGAPFSWLMTLGISL